MGSVGLSELEIQEYGMSAEQICRLRVRPAQKGGCRAAHIDRAYQCGTDCPALRHSNLSNSVPGARYSPTGLNECPALL